MTTPGRLVAPCALVLLASVVVGCARVSGRPPDVQPGMRVMTVARSPALQPDFADIAAALQLARPGDRVLVLDRESYPEFALRRGIDVEALDGASIPRFEIRGVPAGERASIAGFTIQPLDHQAPGIVADCAGDVVLARLDARFLRVDHGVRVQDVGLVVISDSSFVSEGDPDKVYPGLTLARCRCAFVARSRSIGTPAFHGSGGHGLVVAGGTATWLFDVEAIGGNAGQFTGQGGYGLLQGMALDGAAQAVIVQRGACTGGLATAGQPPRSDAIEGLARVTSDTVLLGAARRIVVIPPMTTLVAPAVVELGEDVELRLTGVPGTEVELWFSASLGYQELPGVDEPLLLGQPRPTIARLTLDAAGTASVTFPIPDEPSLHATWAFVQGAAVEPGRSRPTLTPLAVLRLR